MARESGFLKRSRKLIPSRFLDSLIFNSFDNRLGSLNDLSVDLQLRQGTSIRKQSLDERFSQNSVKFVKSLLEEKLKGQISNKPTTDCFDRFSSVKIKDSTRFQLPPSFKDKYPGSGGNASAAGMHIQFEFDLKSGAVNTIKTTDAKRQDNTDAKETIGDIEEGALIIRDLGYFSSKVLKEIDSDRKAYYITRMAYGLKVFRYCQGKFIELNLEKELKAMRSKGIVYQEVDVYLDKKLEKPLRLLMEILPDQEIERRMRKAKDTNTRKGKQLSKGYKFYASMGLFLTNIPKAWVKPEKLRWLYRLRWQIELRFKCWKSLCHIQLTKKMKQHRFETCLYARLLYILIHWEISMALTAMHWKKKRMLLSVYKCYKTLIQCRDLLRNALFKNCQALNSYFIHLEKLDCRNLILEKRKNRLGFSELLLTNLTRKK